MVALPALMSEIIFVTDNKSLETVELCKIQVYCAFSA